MDPIKFHKGHGAGNDFVLLPVPVENLDARTVAAMCDRHRGVGADGVVQVVREGDHFFMDYRNADGSLAQTCGNGIRVFSRFLVESGLEQPGSFIVGTRAGKVRVTVRADDTQYQDIAVEMGQATGLELAAVGVSTETGNFVGSPAFMPNPHCVSVVKSIHDAGGLHEAPVVAPVGAFPEGANFEFIAEISSTHIAMRTYERGVGETLACGSGACAAAAVWAKQQNLNAPWTIQVDVLGGTLFVDSDADNVLTLRGPAVFVATGEFTA
jgi:diaminopimelate epimerase